MNHVRRQSGGPFLPHHHGFAMVLVCGLLAARSALGQEPTVPPMPEPFLVAVPDGYHLHAYDDCGVIDRQPHVVMDDSYLFTLATTDTDADSKSRSAVFSYKSVHLRYEGLHADMAYVLAMTYASDHVYKRVQSLWGNGTELHGPIPLPQAKAIRRIVRIPGELVRSGRLDLQIRIHGEVNATVSIAELWAERPPSGETLRFERVSGLVGDLQGTVLDLMYEPVSSAEVFLHRPSQTDALARTTTGDEGRFRIPRVAFEQAAGGDLELRVESSGRRGVQTIPASRLAFEPIRYRPLPSHVRNIEVARESLGGVWRIDPTLADGAKDRSLDAPGWRDFRVPGQWKQQGMDIPMARTVAVAREFVVPPAWAGMRIFLRFDSIHAATSYWINGQSLGASEHLFTPVEWEITPFAKPGASNRLDLTMRVDSLSESLSYSSKYAFHSLGGIDRDVWIFAVPPLHMSRLRVEPILDDAYRNAELRLTATIDNGGHDAVDGAEITATLFDPSDREVVDSRIKGQLGRLDPGPSTHVVSSRVTAPLLWNAEQPRLYRLVIEVRRGGDWIERIERRIGFRKVETRGSVLLINGVPVKLAGACHHEFDPLTGRADTKRHAATDIRLLKEANLNFVRTSHYPPTMTLVEEADQKGMYLEVEAPFCWVSPTEDLGSLREILTPTTAMVDFYHDHPSVILWSLANESHFNAPFEVAHEWVRQLDPTRPTTFNNPDPRRICEIANVHYPAIPYDVQLPDDPRPLLLGEFYFPVCHEQTDVRINPGLREFYGFGHADPDSAWGKQCAESFARPYAKPCAPPGAWSRIDHAPRMLGGAVWAGLDEAFYFPDGTHAGYAWHHGFWGIVDAWRRPKPEWWITKRVFSPVWFPVRELGSVSAGEMVHIPVENRYSFTNLRELAWSWRIGDASGSVSADIPPRSRGSLGIFVPPSADLAKPLRVEARTTDGMLVQVAAFPLRNAPSPDLPTPAAPAPRVTDDGTLAVIEGSGFSLVFDRSRGEFAADDPRHRAVCTQFPRPHLTQYDFGDLAGDHGKPYAVFPNEATRVVDRVDVAARENGVELIVEEHYDRLAGTMRWRIDESGRGTITFRYAYQGEPIDTREAGVRWTCRDDCDELTWRRWSEWDEFPEDSICRTEGRARAFRDGARARREDPEGARPEWPWSLDQTSQGTADFRSIKFHIYEASLMGRRGGRIRAHAGADRHVRACVADDGVRFHLLTRCELGQVVVRDGDVLEGHGSIELAP